MLTANRPLSVIMKVTKRCNLNCKYCYEGNKTNSDMSIAIAQVALEKIAQESLRRSHGQDCIVDIIWHGGEPLLRGVDFFRSVFGLQRHFKRVVFRNSLQSNLTMLDADWIDFLLLNKVKVGGSLDGPQWVNDAARNTLDGGSSFSKVLANLLAARDKGLKIGVITVIGKHNFSRPRELYHFFKQYGIDFETNMLTLDGSAIQHGDSIAISPHDFGKAVVELFDLWFFDKDKERTLSASSFLKYIIGMLKGTSLECVTSGSCRDKYLSINPDGNVFPCGRYGDLNTPEMLLGNIARDNLYDLIFSPIQIEIANRDAANIVECKNCSYLSLCKGGCPYSAYISYNDHNRPDYFCEAFKIIFSHISARLHEELDSIIPRNIY